MVVWRRRRTERALMTRNRAVPWSGRKTGPAAVLLRGCERNVPQDLVRRAHLPARSVCRRPRHSQQGTRARPECLRSPPSPGGFQRALPADADGTRAGPANAGPGRQLLVRKPENRLGFNGADEIKRSPFFDNVNWQRLQSRAIKPPFHPDVVRTCALFFFLRPCCPRPPFARHSAALWSAHAPF